MDSNMNELLEKYWEGETSLAEEKELKAQLLKQESDEELEEVQMLFKHFDEESKVELDDSFDEMILNEIEKEQNKLQTEDTFESPEAAYEELKKQLLIVSNYLNKGNSAVEGFGSLGTVETELNDFSKLGGASQGFEMLSEMNVKNN